MSVMDHRPVYLSQRNVTRFMCVYSVVTTTHVYRIGKVCLTYDKVILRCMHVNPVYVRACDCNVHIYNQQRNYATNTWERRDVH
jgi:hypothetical protein